MMGNAVKEALDNLPGGVCFFNADGILVLCNRQMYRLSFLLMGHDLQTLAELMEALGLSVGEVCDGVAYHLPDDSWWSVSVHAVTTGGKKRYTEVTAFDISDLQKKKELLQEANDAKRQTVETLERIQDDIVSIAREEEILAMKMELHSEFGYHLQAIRRFYLQGCPADEKEAFLAEQKKALAALRGELDVKDEVDSFDELARLAKMLGMHLVITGEIPGDGLARELLAKALRECLTNTVRHAGGDTVFLALARENGGVRAKITNNGRPPGGGILERGGLLSLRKRIEGSGGTMVLCGVPEFELKLVLPEADSAGADVQNKEGDVL